MTVEYWSPGGPVLYGEDSIDVLAANLGDCLRIDDSNGDSLPKVPCNQPAALELYAVATPPIRNTMRYPDPETTDNLLDYFATGACELAFEDDRGRSYRDSPHNYRVLLPDADAWSAGHTDVYCLLDKAGDSQQTLE